MDKVKFKSWYSNELNIYELVETLVKSRFVTYVLKVLYENPKIKEELIKAIEYFEKFYSKHEFLEDKYYLERLEKIKDILVNVDKIEKIGNVYVGYKKGKIYANYIDNI